MVARTSNTKKAPAASTARRRNVATYVGEDPAPIKDPLSELKDQIAKLTQAVAAGQQPNQVTGIANSQLQVAPGIKAQAQVDERPEIVVLLQDLNDMVDQITTLRVSLTDRLANALPTSLSEQQGTISGLDVYGSSICQTPHGQKIYGIKYQLQQDINGLERLLRDLQL